MCHKNQEGKDPRIPSDYLESLILIRSNYLHQLLPIALTDRDITLVGQTGQILDWIAFGVIFKTQKWSVAGEKARLLGKRDDNVEQLLPLGAHAVAGRVRCKVDMRASQQKQPLLVLFEALEPFNRFRWTAVHILFGVAPQVVEVVASVFGSVVVPVEHEGQTVQNVTPDCARHTEIN